MKISGIEEKSGNDSNTRGNVVYAGVIPNHWSIVGSLVKRCWKTGYPFGKKDHINSTPHTIHTNKLQVKKEIHM